MDLINLTLDSFAYVGDSTPVLRDLQLSIQLGEFVVITGNSGCGKTTVTRLMNGLIPHHWEGTLRGQVQWQGRDIREYDTAELAARRGIVSQNPTDQFFARVAEDEVALVGENLAIPQPQLRHRVRQAFEQMGIAPLIPAEINRLSGGEKQRIAIASTLITDTQAIFFDEPSASLDAEGIEDFRRILQRLKAQGKTVVIAEHRLHFLADLYDSLYVMESGSIVNRYGAGKLQVADTRHHGLRSIKLDHLQAKNTTPLGPMVAEVSDAEIKVKGKTLLREISLALHENQILGIVGANGTGKTTLARTLSGLAGGKQPISWGTRPRKRLNHTYYMMQDVDYQLFFDTVENELIDSTRKPRPEYLDKISRTLKLINLWDQRLMHPQNLSGGQKQRLALANALLSDKEIIVLDEPTSGLDYKHLKFTVKLIRELSHGRPVIVITHDLEFLAQTCNSALVVQDSSCQACSVAQVLTGLVGPKC